MLPNKVKPFIPHKLPLRRLNPSSFNRAHLRATKTLERFERLLNTLPKPQFLLSSLMAAEALAALESQKIYLTLEDFFLLCIKRSSRQKKLLQPINYYDALKKAIRQIPKEHISKNLLCGIHHIVKKGAPPHIQAGDYRTRQNWIGPEGCKKEEAYFFPPPPKIMRLHMHNLLEYAKKPKKDALTHIAILLAQLLIIHPFIDGNGRVARILIPLLFYEKKVLPLPLLFFSRYLKDHRKKYFHRLFKITEADKWEEWVHFFLTGIVHQGKKEYKKAQTLYHLYLKLQKKLAKDYPRQPFLFYLFSHPVFSRSAFINRYCPELLKTLKRLKIIRPFKKGYYLVPALLKILKNKNLEK